MIKLLLYITRWQLSTPILALMVWLLKDLNPIVQTALANFVGALIFFQVDAKIFKK